MAKFDLAQTDRVVRLLATPREQRDDAWRAAFLEAIVDASMASTAEQVLRGPDGFAYFTLKRPPIGQPFTPFCISHLLEHCTDSGLGIVVEPGPASAEWVLSYGELFSLRAYGSFDGDPLDRAQAGAPAGASTPGGTQVMVGAPSEQVLPKWAARVLASFLQGAAVVKEPRVMLLVDPSKPPGRHLVFNVHPEDAPSTEAFERVMRRLGWFLPPSRSVVAISRGSSLGDAFVAL